MILWPFEHLVISQKKKLKYAFVFPWFIWYKHLVAIERGTGSTLNRFIIFLFFYFGLISGRFIQVNPSLCVNVSFICCYDYFLFCSSLLLLLFFLFVCYFHIRWLFLFLLWLFPPTLCIFGLLSPSSHLPWSFHNLFLFLIWRTLFLCNEDVELVQDFPKLPSLPTVPSFFMEILFLGFETLIFHSQSIPSDGILGKIGGVQCSPLPLPFLVINEEEEVSRLIHSPFQFLLFLLLWWWWWFNLYKQMMNIPQSWWAICFSQPSPTSRKITFIHKP